MICFVQIVIGKNIIGLKDYRGRSSVDRAGALQASGHRFNSVRLHQNLCKLFEKTSGG